jgi:hypothetical protein
MKINSDYRDLLQSLNEEHVRYLVVGGYAWMVHTEPRYTKDLDIWIEPTPDNAAALLRALARFGAPTTGISVSDFVKPDVFFQIGVEPVRLNLMTSVPGLQFLEAWGTVWSWTLRVLPHPSCTGVKCGTRRWALIGTGGGPICGKRVGNRQNGEGL